MYPSSSVAGTTRGASLAGSARSVAAAWVFAGAMMLSMLPLSAVPARSSLMDLSLEELMQIEVTTVSKHREKLTNAPAAVFALNADDLQRAGVTTLPDALRLVPGMQVGQVGAHDWAITARGFADVFSNKLLVLQDGRSVYTPLFSGVFWDAQDVIFEDVERIEVVRGPGATLWGANAVNGVINILRKPAADTLGGLGAVAVGSDERYSARARYGAALDDKTHLRVYAKYADYDAAPALAGGDAADAWRRMQTGFRVDRKDGRGNLVTLQGDAYHGHEDQIYLLPAALPPFATALHTENTFTGGNLLGRVTRRFDRSELMVQGYVDYTGRDTAIFDESRRTFDLEAHQQFGLGNQKITFGAGYRFTGDRVRNSSQVMLNPSRRGDDLWSAFVQDDITLAPAVHLIVGSKLEHNDYTGWEVQPGARLLWSASERHTLWASVARAVRTPSRAEDDVFIQQLTSTPGVFGAIVGNRDFGAEKLTAYEAGWRFHAREKFSLDLTAFLNRYDGLRNGEFTLPSLYLLAQLSNPSPAVPLQFPVTIATRPINAMQGETYGGEVALATQVASGWRVRAAYSHLKLHLHRPAGSLDASAEDDEGRSPRHQGYVWSQHDLSARWKIDWVVRAVSRLTTSQVPGYVALDARIAWTPAPRWEMSLTGRNLNDPRHPEFRPAGLLTPAAETARSVRWELKHEF